MSSEPLFAETRIPSGIPSGSILIAPNDDADLSRPIMGLRVDNAGTVKFVTAKGDTDTALLPDNGILVMAIARDMAVALISWTYNVGGAPPVNPRWCAS